MGGVPSGGSTWKNVLIGIFTTVAAYAIVHFLGIGKSKSKAGDSGRIEATQRALQSIIQYEDIAQKTVINIACAGNSSKEQQKVLDEFDQVRQHLLNIKNEKDVDNRVSSIVDNRAGVMEKLKKQTETYFNQVNPLVMDGQYRSSDDSLQAAEAMKTYMSDINEIATDSKTFLGEMIAALKKDYNFKLDYTPADRPITRENLAGVWKINHSVIWQLNSDNSFSWERDQQHYAGTYNVNDSVVSLKFNHGEIANLKVTRLIGNFLMYTNVEDGSYNEACRQ